MINTTAPAKFSASIAPICSQGLCDGYGLIVDGKDELPCDCEAGKLLVAEEAANPCKTIAPFVLLFLDEVEAFEALTEAEKLHELGAPAFAYVDTKDAACCADGLCAECESTI